MARIMSEGKVRLSIDDTGLRGEVQRALRDALRGVQETVRVEVDAVLREGAVRQQIETITRDRTVTIHADLDTRQWERELRNVGRLSTRVLSVAVSGRLWRQAAEGVAAYGAAAAAALPAVAGLGAGLIEATQVLGFVPAAAFGAAAALGTLVIGFQGVGTALGAMDDIEEFNEALKDLSPNARAFARQVRGLRGEFRNLRLTVQDNLFEEISRDFAGFEDLARTALPVLERGLGGIASELSDVVGQWTAWAQTEGPMRDLEGILENIEGFIRETGFAGRDLAAAMTDIVAVGSEFFPTWGDAIGEAAQSFREFIREARETGRLREFLSEGASAFGDLALIVRNVGSIISSIFTGLAGDGGEFLESVRDITGEWAEFLKSVEGQEDLKTARELLSSISLVLRTVLKTAFEELGPVIEEILPFITEFAKALAEILAGAIRFVAPILRELAEFLGDNTWIATALAGVAALSVALRGLRLPLAFLLSSLGKLSRSTALSGAAAQSTIFATQMGRANRNTRRARGGLGLLARGARGLGRALPVAATAIFLDDILAIETEGGGTFNPISDSLSLLSGAITDNDEALRNTLNKIGVDTTTAGQAIAGLGQTLSGEFDKADRELNKARLAVRVFGGDVRREGIGSLNNLATVAEETWQQSVARTATDAARVVRVQTRGAISSAGTSIAGLGQTARSVFEQIGATSRRTSTSIGSSARDAVNATGSAYSTLRERSAGIFSQISSQARGEFNEMSRGARVGRTGILSAFSGIGGQIRRQFAGIGDAGLQIALDVASGIRDGRGAVISAAGSLAAAVRGALPSSPAEYGPLSGDGYPLLLGRKISEQLGEGILQARGAVEDGITGVTGDLRDILANGGSDFVSEGLGIGEDFVDGLERGLDPLQALLDSAMSAMMDTLGTRVTPDIDLSRVQAAGAPGAGAGVPAGAGGFSFQQTNIMRPGTDARQFADTVLRRGMDDFASGASTLPVVRTGVQSGVNDQLVTGVQNNDGS